MLHIQFCQSPPALRYHTIPVFSVPVSMRLSVSQRHTGLCRKGKSTSLPPGSSTKAPVNVTERNVGPSTPQVLTHPSFIGSTFCLLIFIQKIKLSSGTELSWRVFEGTMRLTSVARLKRWPPPRASPSTHPSSPTKLTL